MKKLLILFGLLDLSVIIVAYRQIISLMMDWTTLNYFSIRLEGLLMYLSLGFSAYFLLRQNKIGLWLTYGQFPFRLLSSVFSFSFLLRIPHYFYSPSITIYFYGKEDFFNKGLIGLEIIRLVITILVHLKFFNVSTSALTL
jgi:hypothetical protein